MQELRTEPGPLEEQLLLLTAEPSLQSQLYYFLEVNCQRYYSGRSGGSTFLCAGKWIMCLFTSVLPRAPDTSSCRREVFVVQAKRGIAVEQGTRVGTCQPGLHVVKVRSLLTVVGSRDASASAQRTGQGLGFPIRM